MLDAELETMRDVLIETARRGDVIHYAPLGRLYDLDMANPQHRIRIGEMLGEISRHEVQNGRPMLSSVVVHGGDNPLPGRGFFKLGVELGVVRAGEDEVEFAVRQLKESYKVWRQQ